MLKAALFENDLPLARFITDRVMIIVKDVLSDYEIDFPAMSDEGLDTLVMQELLCRQATGRTPLFVPLSVADQAEPLRFWLLTAFQELIEILTDTEKVIRPGLRCEYLIVRLIEAYIDNMYGAYAPEKPDSQAFCCVIPSELDALIKAYRKEAREDEEGFGEDFSSSDIESEIRNGLADIRCWIDHPDAPDYYGDELLLEDEDYLFLDKYDEGSLYYSDSYSGLGVFQWRGI